MFEQYLGTGSRYELRILWRGGGHAEWFGIPVAKPHAGSASGLLISLAVVCRPVFWCSDQDARKRWECRVPAMVVERLQALKCDHQSS